MYNIFVQALICYNGIKKGDAMSDTFYVDPVKEAQKYGINVYGDTNFEHLQEHESGIIKKDGDKITIYVNPNDSLERQRFTIAHELGHFISGHLNSNNAMLRDGSKIYTQDNYDYKEYEANKYAAELLMPEDKLEFLLNNEGINTVEGLAKALIVSPTAMLIRLKNLGWVS